MADLDDPHRAKRFASRVLSSTRISEANSQHEELEEAVPKVVPQRRRRLRLLDEEDDEEHGDLENIDPSLTSFPLLPSSIPVPEPSDEDEDENEDGRSSDSAGSNRSELVESGEDDEYFVHPKYSDNRPNERRLDGRGASPTLLNERDTPMPDVTEAEASKDDEVDEDVLNRLRRLAKGAAKKTVKHPRPKLDPPLLLGDKGLPALLEDFQKVRFRGKGYEFQDLDRLLFVYEAWANRILTKSSFPEIIERLEKVGTRREIQVALHRLRNGIWPPYISVEQVEDDDSDVPMKEPGPPMEVEDEEAAWERALHTMPVSSEPVNVASPSASLLEYESSFNEEPPEPVPGPSSVTPTLSEEDRAERNRRLALERLAARASSSPGTQLSQAKTTPRTPSLLKNALKATLSRSTHPVENSVTEVNPANQVESIPESSSIDVTVKDASDLLLPTNEAAM